jgi:hypothetical protein
VASCPTRWLKPTVVLVAMPCLAMVCGAFAKFQISGDVDSGVVFALSDLPPKGRRLTVKELVIGEPNGAEVWRLRGRATVARIVYGQAPAGLAAELGPTPLRANTTYYIVVRGEAGWLGQNLWGTCNFTVDSSGRVQPEEGCRTGPPPGERTQNVPTSVG